MFHLDETETRDSPQNRQLPTATTAWTLNLGLTRGQGGRFETMVVLKYWKFCTDRKVRISCYARACEKNDKIEK